MLISSRFPAKKNYLIYSGRHLAVNFEYLFLRMAVAVKVELRIFRLFERKFQYIWFSLAVE